MRLKILFLAVLTSCITFAQQLKTPSEFLGYPLGSKFTRHHKVVDYFNYLAKNSTSLQLTKYGETNEGRTLLIAYVSTPKNLTNLEEIRNKHLSTTQVNNSNANSDKSVVWLSYNVHGNEASSTEASMLTAYKLITEKQDWLANTVVIMDPCMNPDGRDRYVNWYNQVANKNYNTNPIAREHKEPWPSGRPNHYLFDLNRDWAWATQVETQQRLKVYNKWLPHIHVDFHEQGINEPYYFAPAAEPFHEIITDFQRDFQHTIGKNHSHHFDDNGWLYFTRERFDLLYPSYGDTYPTFNGAIGMTYEQAGHGRAGLGITTEEGDVLTLVDRLQHHTTTGLSTVEVATKNANKLTNEFKKYFGNTNYTYKSYVLKGDIDKQNQLKALLDKHEISYAYAKAQTVTGFDYTKNKNGQLKTSTKDLVISINQPKAALIKALFEPKAAIKDSLTYDITAWSLPYAYGFKALASKKQVATTSATALKNKAVLKNKPYAYIFNWNHISDATLLSDLLNHNIRIRFNEKLIENSGHKMAPGTLIVTQRDNKHLANFDKLVFEITKKYNKPTNTIKTGFATKGSDIGSPDVKEIKNQKIAVLAGDVVSSLSFGEVQYFLEQDLKYPYTAINTNMVSESILNKFHTLILPNGWYSGIFNKERLKTLKKWVSKGGKVIAIGNANRVFASSEDFALSFKEKAKKDDKEENKSDADLHLISYADSEREGIKDLITGAIFKTKVDNTHPLAFGYNDEYFTLRLSAKAYDFIKDEDNVVRLEDNTVISGFAGANTIPPQQNSLVFGVDNIGNGGIIHMVDNPLFRAFWDNGKLFFANALFMTNVNLERL